MSTIGMIFTIAGIVIILFWIFLFFTGNGRFKEDTKNAVSINKEKKINSVLNDFICPEMLFIGFRFMEIIGYEMKSDYSKKKIREIILMNG